MCPLFLVETLADTVILLGMPFFILMAYLPMICLSDLAKSPALQDHRLSALTETLKHTQSSNIRGFFF